MESVNTQLKRHKIKGGRTKKIININHSAFMKSPRSDEIMEIVKTYKDKVSQGELYTKVKAIDENLPGIESFRRFLIALDYRTEVQARELMNQMSDILTEEGEMDKDALKNMLGLIFKKTFAMGNAVVEQEMKDIKEKLERGEQINDAQQKKIMNWVFRGSDQLMKQQVIDLKDAQDEREQTLVDGIILAMQYGKADKGLLVEGEIEEIKPRAKHT